MNKLPIEKGGKGSGRKKGTSKEQIDSFTKQLYKRHDDVSKEENMNRVKDIVENAYSYFSEVGISPDADDIEEYTIQALADETGVNYDDVDTVLVSKIIRGK